LIAMSHFGGQGLSSQHDTTIRDQQPYFSTNDVDVGITIPGLDMIIFPDWEYGGSGVRYKLCDLTLKQRSGRVGRTNNGIVHVVKSSDDALPPAPSSTREGAWQAAMAAGISPALGWKMDPDAMQSLFGLDKIEPDKVQEFSRVSHIFLTNFRAMKALEMEHLNMNSPVGKPAVLFPAGTNLPRLITANVDLAETHMEAMNLLNSLLKLVQQGGNVYDLIKNKIAALGAGPIYKVSNVMAGLANDPLEWKPELRSGIMDVPDIDFDSEIKKINDLIDTLRGA